MSVGLLLLLLVLFYGVHIGFAGRRILADDEKRVLRMFLIGEGLYSAYERAATIDSLRRKQLIECKPGVDLSDFAAASFNLQNMFKLTAVGKEVAIKYCNDMLL